MALIKFLMVIALILVTTFHSIVPVHANGNKNEEAQIVIDHAITNHSESFWL